MELTIGFSPCPNDTYIFDALIHQKIETNGLSFKLVMADVEELNKLAIKGVLDITKLSYHAYTYVANEYMLLNTGSALGNNCGPLLIAKKKLSTDQINVGTVAIPGKMTTANFLFSIFYPKVANKKEVLFSDIETGVLNGGVDAGVIIHENRFTYQDKGLTKIIDLGEKWETSTKLPIPLGGIALKRTIDHKVAMHVESLIKQSILYANRNPLEPLDFIKAHAQEMDQEVMYKHIDLYVNEYSLDLGSNGRKAIETMFSLGMERNIIPLVRRPYLLNN